MLHFSYPKTSEGSKSKSSTYKILNFSKGCFKDLHLLMLVLRQGNNLEFKKFGVISRIFGFFKISESWDSNRDFQV